MELRTELRRELMMEPTGCGVFKTTGATFKMGGVCADEHMHVCRTTRHATNRQRHRHRGLSSERQGDGEAAMVMMLWEGWPVPSRREGWR